MTAVAPRKPAAKTPEDKRRARLNKPTWKRQLQSYRAGRASKKRRPEDCST